MTEDSAIEEGFPPFFRAVHQMVRAEGVEVLLHARHPSGERRASYIARPTRPVDVIEVWALRSVSELDDIEDTINLAHELGHRIVHRDGREPPSYRELISSQDRGEKLMDVWKDEPEATRQAVVEVEQYAWDEAIKILERAGFQELARAVERASLSIAGYRVGLSLCKQ